MDSYKRDEVSSDLFDGLLPGKRRKTKVVDFFTCLSISFILFTLADACINFQTMSFKRFEWQVAVFLLFLPVTGLIFHIAGKKAGWIFNIFFYGLLAIFMLAILLFFLVQGSKQYVAIFFEWEGILFTVLVTMSAIALLTKGMRMYFDVSKDLLITMILISTILAAVLSYFLIQEQLSTRNEWETIDANN